MPDAAEHLGTQAAVLVIHFDAQFGHAEHLHEQGLDHVHRLEAAERDLP